MIRPATLEDLTRIVARGQMHHDELGIPVPFDAVSTAQTVATLTMAGTLLVHEDLDGYIGFTVEPCYFNHAYRFGYEQFWYVMPAARGTGLGTDLLHAAEERARAMGATAFHAQLPEASQDATRLAEALGYELAHGIYRRAL